MSVYKVLPSLCLGHLCVLMEQSDGLFRLYQSLVLEQTQQCNPSFKNISVTRKGHLGDNCTVAQWHLLFLSFV